jgi:hypothetical protein
MLGYQHGGLWREVVSFFGQTGLKKSNMVPFYIHQLLLSDHSEICSIVEDV